MTESETRTERLLESADPLSGLMLMLSGMAALDTLTGWREDWGGRTRIGKAGLLLGAPLQLCVGVVCAITTAVFGAVVLAEAALFVLPNILYRAYRERAFKGDRDV